MKSKSKDYVWVIAYIEYDLVKKLDNDLKKSNQYSEIEYLIPTVRVLKKQFKNKDYFKEVPLLFNYGFFKIPINLALNIDLLNTIKSDISCISNWVKDKAKKPGRPKNESENDKLAPYRFGERDVPVATTDSTTIDLMCKIADESSIFSSEEINRVKPGNIIYLRGYPFEGMRARVESIDPKRRKIKVGLADLMDEEEESYGMVVEVHFDNVFYSLYQGSYDERYNEERLLEDYHTNRNKTKNNRTDETL